MTPTRLTRWRRRTLRRAALVIAALAGLTPWSAMAQGATPPVAASATQAVYAVSVVPQFPAVDIARTWTPILEQLGQQVGARFELKVARDIPSFEADVKAGLPDFAYMNPFHQVRAKRAQGYVPLVRDTELLTGILVVRKDDPIRSTRQLEGQTLAFPAPNAFGASLLIRAQLDEVDRVRITPFYARTHTNAYRQTLAGKAAATGGLRATLEREPPEVQAGLRILFETPGAAPHPLSAHPRVPVAVQRAVQAAWFKLAQDSSLRANFADVPMPRPVKADHARDYAPLERLKLDRYAQ
jgi:phosphonate transport system substrate-binding protein